MAVDTFSITRPTGQHISLDYDALYAEGITHIQSLSGKLWTDYNAHDPGITILELMCYAITELGYRSDYEVKDIITPSPDEAAVNDFFTLAQVGSIAPLTITDYRKVLIDLEGIRNAWLEKAARGVTAIALDGTRTALSAYADPALFPTGNTEVKLRGLYNVYVQFEEDPDFGDLNDNSISGNLSLDLVGKDAPVIVQVEVEFPLFESLNAEFDAIVEHLDDNGFDMVASTLVPQTGEAFVYAGTIILNPLSRAVPLDVIIRVVSGTEEVLNKDDFKNQLQKEFTNLVDASLPLTYAPGPSLYTYTESIQLLVRYIKRHQRIQALLSIVEVELANRRNLCEDFLNVFPMSLQEIGLTLQMEVEPGADLEEITAEVYYRTEQYLNPTIQFYSLREMLDKGYEPEEIFRGPALVNGFLDEGELSFQQQRDTLYISDLIHAFMEISGVKTIQTISLSRYKEGKLVDVNRTECLRLENPQNRLPRLNFSRSSIQLDNGSGTPTTPDMAEVLDILGEKKALNQLKGDTGDNDFALPSGTYTAFSSYYSIQHEFPINYAIGMEGLAPSETDLRKGQSQQLKAYLLFYEQLLADFMAQLANVRKLYTFQNAVDRTYYTQMLLDVPRVKDLIRDFTDANGSIDWSDYADYASLGRPSHYQHALDAAAESADTFNDRRKRFLDHLLARFNESFSDYATYIFATQYDEATQYSTLIGDQVRFLQNYVSHSRDRATAFNYRDTPVTPAEPTDFWDPARVPGLKKRITYLAGLPTVPTQWINPYDQFVVGAYPSGYALLDGAGVTMMASVGSFADQESCFDDIDLVLAHGLDAARYITPDANFPDQVFLTSIDAGNVVTQRMQLDTSYLLLIGDTATAIANIVARMQAIAHIENMHIVEHILLRPRAVGDRTLAVRHYADCAAQSIYDPYSFRISVVLPTWAGRFQEIAYRRMFKKMLRIEAPAHVYIHFHWINPREMYAFEHCWLDWLNGEWLAGDTRILQENQPFLLQEDQYFLLVERDGGSGEDETFFVDCLSNLANRYDAYYIMEPARIVDQYADCDLIGRPVDPDGEIVRAWLAPGEAMPLGLCLHPCNGEIRVEDRDQLANDQSEYQLNILTLNVGGEVTTHDVTVQFIPNGPATIVPPSPFSKHIYLWENDDTIAHFIDLDGSSANSNGIIQATLISVFVNGTATANVMPAGMAMDPLSGRIYVTNAASLVPADYRITVKLMDTEGGVTTLGVPFSIFPDIPAVATVTTPDSKSEDAYQDGDILVTITDDTDLGIDLVEPRPNQLTPLSTYSLEIVYNASDPTKPKAEIKIINANDFRAALPTYYSLLTGSVSIYRTTLKLRSTDKSRGKTDLDVELRIRRDTAPTYTVSAKCNIDAYLVNDVIATIADTNDNGLDSIAGSTSMAPSLTTRGLSVSIAANLTGLVKVADVAVFKAYLGTISGGSGPDILDTISLETVDKTGGIATVTLAYAVIKDHEPENVTLPPKVTDSYITGEVVAYIRDANQGGVIAFDPVSSAPTLGQMGLAKSIGAYTGEPGPVGRVTVQDKILLQNAMLTGLGFVLVDTTTQLHRLTMPVTVTDATGGKGSVDLIVEAFLDNESYAQSVKNGLRADQIFLGDDLWKIQDPDFGVANVSLIAGNLPSYAQIVVDPVGHVGYIRITSSNVAAFNGTVTVRVLDNRPPGQQGQSDIVITVTVMPRQLQMSFSFTTGGTSKDLPFTDFHPNLRINLQQNTLSHTIGARTLGGLSAGEETNPSASFGTAQRLSSTRVVFQPGSAFVGSVGHGAYTFAAHLINTNEQVEVVFRVSYQNVRGPKDISNIRTGITSTPNAQNNSVSGLTKDLLNNVSKARTFADNPLVKTNPKAVGAIVTGQKDQQITNDFTVLMEATTKEIERLKSVITYSTGTTQTQARKDLQSAAALYQEQLMGAIMFAGEVRVADLKEDDPVKTMFVAIQNQLKRIQ